MARRYINTASICNLLDVRGSRTLVLILRNQRNRLCAMFSVFVDADDNGRGPISCHAAGTEIQRECNSEAHYIALAIVWVVCIVSGLCFDANYRLTFLAQLHTDAVQSVILIASCTMIFRALNHHLAQLQDHVQQQSNKTNAPNMARYRKAEYSALWVPSALVVCYEPNLITEIVIYLSLNRLSNFSMIIIIIRHNGEHFGFL